MHKKYGPVVRVRPDTLHANDPSLIDKIYPQSLKQRRERYWTVYQTFQAPGSMFSARDHHLHRRRRAVLNPFFSMQNVRRLEPTINDALAHLLHRMEGWAKDGQPVQITHAFRAATKDVIQGYAFGEGPRCLDMEDCNAGFFEVMLPQRISHLGTHVYWLASAMANTPPSIMTKLYPRIGIFAMFVQVKISPQPSPLSPHSHEGYH